jgi:threonylcarbamoyladenosine tRNA methylthiotransferase MtaB
MPPPKLTTATLGCKVNQYETQYVRQALLKSGYVDALDDQPADLCVVNTCTVTAEGDAKSRQVIRRLARRNPHARIVVMGCYATRAPAEIEALPGVVDVLADRRELPDLLGRLGATDLPTGIDSFGTRHRAYVKVQDGCMLRCSYCIIPYVRPSLTSRPPAEVLAEVRRLVDRGYRELVLTGIHLGHYGVDFNRGQPKRQWVRLSHLLDQIAQLPGDFRVRISSIEATETTRELLDVIAAWPDRVVPHLHVSMQSGADAVLRRMKRRWGARRFLDRCALIQQRLDLPALTTDILVGFPGETDRDFEQTCAMARQVGFSKIHIFPFSARRGTPAAEMPHQIPPPIKRTRCRQLADLAAQLRDDYFASLIDRRLQVLIESPVADRPGMVAGTACRYAPVELPGSDDQCGQLVDGVATQVADGRILAARIAGPRSAQVS